MAADDWLSAGATLLGGLLGSSNGATNTTTTSTNSIDPQMKGYIYGNGSNIRGVLPAATDWYQNNQSGLNDQSLQGLNRQWNVASDPNTAQGYTNMQSLGSSLMGGGVASNPFTTGKVSLAGGNGGLGLGGQSAQTMQQPQFQNPATMGSSMSGSSPFTQPTTTWQPQTQQAAINSWLQQVPSSYSSSGNGGGYSGTNSAGTGDLSGLMSSLGSFASNNPGAISTIAGLLGGPAVGLGVKGLLGLLGGGSGSTTNSAISSMANGYGMGGWGGGGNSSSDNGGGDSSRGSQSDNGGRNGGDSGGF